MMNKIPFSQMEGILTQKRDLRKKWCCCTHLVAAKASNTKGFVDFSRSVALSDPITRGLKDLTPISKFSSNYQLHCLTR